MAAESFSFQSFFSRPKKGRKAQKNASKAFFELKKLLSYDDSIRVRQRTLRHDLFMISGRSRSGNKSRSPFRFLLIFLKLVLALSVGGFVIAIPMILDREIIPVISPDKPYSAAPVSCAYHKSVGTQIKFLFETKGRERDSIPNYSVQEIPEKGKTIVTFEKTADLSGEFAYNDVINNPLIELLDYRIKDGRLIIEITRKGDYLPARVVAAKKLATIILPIGGPDYPQITNQRPAQNSAAFPAKHPISFDANLQAPLQNIYIMFNDEPAQFSVSQTATSTYSFIFEKELKIDTDYSVKAIITDSTGRTSISSWGFTGQIPSAAILGKDRFKYLGWWGQIAASGVTVRAGAGSSFDKVGVLSSAERVKVIEEIFGEWVDNNNLWYKIDGGKYAGKYVFSDFVTPMAQPEPPAEFTVPEGVAADETWIDVDLSKKVMTLFKYDKPVFSTYIADGRKENPTQTGIFRVWYKLNKTTMRGGPPLHTYRYNLKDIPWTMFYNYDYAIHGTYWHDRFGSQQSAGCTNMTQGDAKYIFDNTLPKIPEGKTSVFSRGEDGKGTGTVVYNHN